MHNFGSSNPIMRDSIFWSDGSEIANDDTSAPTIADSIIAGGCPVPPGTGCTNVLDADPVLGTLANNGGLTETMTLLATSSAIDAGNNGSCASTDQRGAYARWTATRMAP